MIRSLDFALIMGLTSNRADRADTPIRHAVLAQNGHGRVSNSSPHPGVKRKPEFGAVKAVFDPIRTYRNRKALNLDGTEGLRRAPRRPLLRKPFCHRKG